MTAEPKTSADGSDALAEGVNLSTRQTFVEIRKLLKEFFPTTAPAGQMRFKRANSNQLREFPATIEDTPMEGGDICVDVIGKSEKRDAWLESNKKLHQAFERYCQAASQKNPLYDYILQHLEEGFTEEELIVLTSGLIFRGMPTQGSLAFGVGMLHKAGIITDAIRQNARDEFGGARDKYGRVIDSHTELYFESVRRLRILLEQQLYILGAQKKELGQQLETAPAAAATRQLGVSLIDSPDTYKIVAQLLRFRKEGIAFERSKEKDPYPFRRPWERIAPIDPNNFDLGPDPDDLDHGFASTQIDDPNEKSAGHNECQRFNDLCGEEGLILPHHARWADNANTLLDARGRQGSFIEGPGTTITPNFGGALLGVVMPLADRNILNQHLFSQPVGEDEFNKALEISKLLPVDMVEYADKTFAYQGEPTEHPNDGGYLVKHLLDLLAREANADKGSHVDAYQLFTTRYAGHLAPELRHLFKLWSDTHVGGTHGVEKDHANDARRLFLAFARATNNNKNELTDAFNFVANEGYLKLHYDHMQHIVDAMQKCRDRAMRRAQAGGEDLFIKPKNVEEVSRWTDRLRQAVGTVRSPEVS